MACFGMHKRILYLFPFSRLRSRLATYLSNLARHMTIDKNLSAGCENILHYQYVGTYKFHTCRIAEELEVYSFSISDSCVISGNANRIEKL